MNKYDKQKKALERIFKEECFQTVDSFSKCDFTQEEIEQACDDVVTDFMIENFGVDWQDDEQAMDFYTETACDIRGDYERDLIDNLNKYINR